MEDIPKYRTKAQKPPTIKERVRLLLKQYPELRDCDKTLQVAIWRQDMKNISIVPHETTVLDFFDLFKKGTFTVPESLKTIRESLQEEDKQLRGINYDLRFLLSDHQKREENGYEVTETEPVKPQPKFKQKMLKL